MNKPLALEEVATVTASFWLPGEWITSAPGTAYCFLGDAACSRQLEFAVEVGLEDEDIGEGLCCTMKGSAVEVVIVLRDAPACRL